MVVRADKEDNGICVFSHEALKQNECYQIVTVRSMFGACTHVCCAFALNLTSILPCHNIPE